MTKKSKWTAPRANLRKGEVTQNTHYQVNHHHSSVELSTSPNHTSSLPGSSGLRSTLSVKTVMAPGHLWGSFFICCTLLDLVQKRRLGGSSWKSHHVHLAAGHLGIQKPRGWPQHRSLGLFTMNEMLIETASQAHVPPTGLLCGLFSSSLTLKLTHTSWICRRAHLVFLGSHP